MADRQTAARGRRGRAWSSPKGNFAGTLVMRPRAPVAEWPLRSFTAGLATYEAVAGNLQVSDRDPRGSRLALKWPNDVLFDDGKLAGILLETSGDALLIGIGVNLTEAPPAEALEPDAMPPATLGGTVTPDAFLAVLISAMERWEQRLREEGFAPVRDEWQKRAARIGQPIRARTGDAERRGVFEGLADDGALILVTEAGRQHIPAADVYFR